MAFALTCPNCDARLSAPDEVAGKRIKCKSCGEAFVARRPRSEGMAEEAPPAKGRPKPVPDDDTPQPKADRPARSRDDADEPERPRRHPRDQDDDRQADEPRGRKGKAAGREEEKSGLPVLLIALVCGGGLLVMGGGVVAAVYFLAPKEPPTQPAAFAPPPPGGPGGGAAPKAGTPKAGPPKAGPPKGDDTGGWVEAREATGRYRIKFPQAPQTLTKPVPGYDGNTVQMRFYTLDVGPEMFLSTYNVLPEKSVIPNETLLKLVVEGMAVAGKGNAQRSSSPIAYQDLPGHQVVVDRSATKDTVVVRGVLARGRIILLMTGGPSATADSPRVKMFLDSLKIE